jgi:outer membrane scaffolding protein for murein synthesis (MipA/OmpV family)
MRPCRPAAPARSDDQPSGIRRFGAACALGLSLIGSAPACAADVLSAEPLAVVQAPPAVSDLYIVTLNANLKVEPRFPGSDRFTLLGYPSISLRRAGEPQRFTAPDDGLSFSFLESQFLRFGVVGRYESGRYFGDDRKNLFGLREVKWSVEPGAFVEAWPVEWLRARAEVRYGLHGYEGVVGNLGLDVVQRFGRFTVSLGPRLAFGDTAFTSAFFSVTPFEAALNGRVTPFRAKGGGTSAGVLGALTYQWSEQWATTLYAGFDRLVGDAGDSPITRRLGSRDQFTVGARLSYSFAITPFWR